MHIVATILLIINAVVCIVALIKDYYFLIVGLSCVAFLVVIIIIGVFVERRIKRNIKDYIEEYAGIISDEDKALAKEILKRWKKFLWKAENLISHGFTGKKHQGFEGKITEDLVNIKKGIKVETSTLYGWLQDKVVDEPTKPQPELIIEICELVVRNSYILDFNPK